MTRYVVAGVGMTRFGRHLDRSMRSLVSEAVHQALAHADARTEDIGLSVFANAAAGIVTGQEMIRGQAALREFALGGAPVINVENACASGGTAIHVAHLALKAGQTDAVLVVGAEKLFHQDKAVSFRALAAGVDLEESRLAGNGTGSLFMDIYAQKTREYMQRSGASVADFADVSVKNRRNASQNEKAQFQEPVSRDDVLASRMISDPLTLLMCSPIGDGAAAALICTEQRARRWGSRPVFLEAAELVSANKDGAGANAVNRAARRAYETSGLGPDDLHVAEVHDASSPAELLAYEDLQFCALSEGAAFLRSGATRIDGRLAVNPSGGLVGRGHPVGATGVAQLYELTKQLRGEAGTRQRPDARVGLAQVAGGAIGHDAAAAAVTILSR